MTHRHQGYLHRKNVDHYMDHRLLDAPTMIVHARSTPVFISTLQTQAAVQLLGRHARPLLQPPHSSHAEQQTRKPTEILLQIENLPGILAGAIHPTSERVALTITSVGYERDGIDEIAQRANLKYTAIRIWVLNKLGADTCQA
jgi:hypothetical protein